VHWMDLTSNDLPRAVRECAGLCLVPLGCLERHGPHLPLGTDTIVADAVARRAAEQEPAVVFPALYLGQIAEARPFPGAVSLPHGLLLELLTNVLDEIGRNGFQRIIICNAHGGNDGLLDVLMRSLQNARRDYIPYVFNAYLWELPEEDRRRWAEMRATSRDGHAGESETSLLMHLRPDSVRMENFTDPSDGVSRNMQAALGGVRNPWAWYARFPTHFGGDPTHATAEKGQFLIDAFVRRLVAVMRAVKADEVTPRLAREFYDRAEHPDTPGTPQEDGPCTGSS